LQRPTDPKAGEIRDVNFDPQVGHEQGGRRPALVVSSNRYKAARNNLFIVCPLTTRERRLPYHVPVGPIEGVLPRPSFVMCEQVGAQDLSRFLAYRGTAPDGVRRQARKIIENFLDEVV
jgi:mRNA interferase MazF